MTLLGNLWGKRLCAPAQVESAREGPVDPCPSSILRIAKRVTD